MIFRIMKLGISIFVLQLTAICSLAVAQTATNTNSQHINLLQRYPTTLSKGNTNPKEAREWKFSKDDIYFLSEFSLKVGDALEVKMGSADVGIGHCADGAVWAVVIPRKSGTLSSSVSTEPESVDHLWLRFHPAEIIALFPEGTVKIAEDERLWERMLKIANMKIRSSWQAGGRAMIPERKDLTVDADTKKRKRRFFAVDTKAATARYIRAFENRTVPEDKPFSKELAESSFDQLWDEYDRKYAMFTLRPEINWEKLREHYRPEALECKTAYEFARVCAEMLKHLRDLHIWVRIDGQSIPVFNRPRERNANPSAFEAIIGELYKAGKYIAWGKTAEKVGFIVINSWRDDVDKKFDEVLENMRDTRGLIIDVRLNGGGSEPMATNVAGRFADKEYIYAYSQYRNGPNHTDLTEKYPRKIKPRGSWRYDRPVVLLMGQKCMSSNESFVSMMAECPQVTTMGDHTCGSSGNPKSLDLPVGVRISMPRWIDLLPDETSLDEHGVKPDIYFPTRAECFEGNHDDLLQAAIDRLSKESLPSELIAGASIESIRSKRPRVVSVFPANNTENVEPDTEIRIRFDRPMNSGKMALYSENWEDGAIVDNRGFKYDEGNNEFIIDVRLKEGTQYNLVINPYKEDGFVDIKGNVAQKFNWRFKTRKIAIAKTASKPVVRSIDPAKGSEIALVTKLKITFDQPMYPDQYEFFNRTTKNSNVLRRNVEYDPATFQFTIPVVFPPNWKGTIEFHGFKSVKGIEADPVKIEYSTGKDIFSQSFMKSLNASQKSDDLIDLLEKIQKMRSNLRSLSEAVYMTHSSDNRTESNRTIFKLKGRRQFYADVSDVMGVPFHIGSDGENCWWYYGREGKERLIMASFDEIDDKNVIICDPFYLTENDVVTAIKKFNLEYLGTRSHGGKVCHIIRSWSVSIRSWKPKDITDCKIGTYWIDSETYMPVQIENDFGLFNLSYVFNYIHINEPLAGSNFRPDFVKGVEPQDPDVQFKDLPEHQFDKKSDKRFLNVQDGSSGNMSVRWGKYGPKGTVSSGLN
jgi:outer membrane lipoprotein-sorting protein